MCISAGKDRREKKGGCVKFKPEALGVAAVADIKLSPSVSDLNIDKEPGEYRRTEDIKGQGESSRAIGPKEVKVETIVGGDQVYGKIEVGRGGAGTGLEGGWWMFIHGRSTEV